MRYLFINTAVSVSTVAFIENNTVLSICDEYNSNDLSEKIFLMIDKVFNESGYTPNDLNKIFVINGPGSFTGIRIGLAIAKTMAWALNIDLIPISCLELIATTPSNVPVVSLIDARRNYGYAGVYDNDLEAIMLDKYISLEELAKLYPETKVKYVSYDMFNMIKTEKPVIDYIKVIKKHENDAVISCHKVNPVYLKLTEAEEKRNQNEHCES
jgi:tRNA threonylcarbamoyladenosine biosynthesis protein TsaB